MDLLDIHVVWELRRAKAGKADKNVTAWATSVPVPNLFLSVITILEFKTGTLLAKRRDSRQGAVLRAWMDTSFLRSREECSLRYRGGAVNAQSYTCPILAPIGMHSSPQPRSRTA